MECVRRRLQDIPLFAIRHIGPYNQMESTMDQLAQLVQQFGLEAIAWMMVFHDDPMTVAADRLRSDVAVWLPMGVPVPVAQPDPGHGTVHGYTLPAQEYLMTVLEGSYAGLPALWQSFAVQADTEGLNPGMPCFEIYLNDPMHTPEAELRTELYLPIAP